jgi:hypothetical protein
MENKDSKKENASISTFRPKSYMLGYIQLDSLEPTTLGQPTKNLQDVFAAANRLTSSNDVEDLKKDNLGLAMYQGSSIDDCELIHFLFDSGWEACDKETLKLRLAGGAAPDMPHIPKNTENTTNNAKTLRLPKEDNMSVMDFKQDAIVAAQRLKFDLSLACPVDMLDTISADIDYVKKQDWFQEIVGKNRWSDTAAFDIVRNVAQNGRRATDYPFADIIQTLRYDMETGHAENITGHYTEKENNQVVLSMLLNYIAVDGASDKIKRALSIPTTTMERINSVLIQQAVVNANVFLLRVVDNAAKHNGNPEKVEKSLKSLPQDNQVSLYRAGINTAMNNIELAFQEFNMRLVSLSQAQKDKVLNSFQPLAHDAKVNFILGHLDTIDFAIDPAFNDLLLSKPKTTTSTRLKP